MCIRIKATKQNFNMIILGCASIKGTRWSITLKNVICEMVQVPMNSANVTVEVRCFSTVPSCGKQEQFRVLTHL